MAQRTERYSPGFGVSEWLSLESWQAACEGRLRHDLQVWVDRMAEGQMWDCLGELRQTLQQCLLHLHYLFTFVPFASDLHVYGTTPNEGGHHRLNRRTKFVTHMRPDKTAALLRHMVFLINSLAAANAAKNGKLPEAVRRLCAGLFLRPAGIPCQAVAERRGVPYIMPYVRPVRVYGRPEFDSQFGLQGGLVL